MKKVAVFAGAFAMMLAGCSSDSSETKSTLDLVVGDCFNDVDEEQITEVPIVDCATPHDNEVYYLLEVEFDDYPTNLSELGYNGCLEHFDAFVGEPFEESKYQVYPMTPTSSSWENNDREVVCSVWVSGEKMTGTAKAS